MSGPTTHSALGASAAERWFACPASARMSAQLPEPPESPYAKEGTRAHALAECCLTTNIWKADKFVGCPVPGHDDKTLVTEDMASAVQVYLDFVRDQIIIGAGRSKYHVEVKFKLPWLAPDLDGSVPGGTCDCCILHPDQWLDVVDYKHGAGKYVPVIGNKQGLYYALGAQTYFASVGVRIKGVRITIVQPRCNASDEHVRTWAVSTADLFDFKQELIAAAHKAREPKPAFVPGAHCRGTWCKGADSLACTAFKQAATAGVIKETRPAPDLPPIDLTVTTPDVTRLDSAELGLRLTQADLLGDYLKCLKEHAVAEARAGRMPQGHKWVLGRGSRQWTSEGEAIKALQRQSNDEFAPRQLVSVAQAEKLIGKKRFNDAAELKAVVTKVAGKPQLATLADDRPEWRGPADDIELPPVELD